MFEFVVNLFDTTGFVPRSMCGEWTPALVWMHVGGDLFIWLAYISIPLVLLYFTRRRDLPYPGLFLLFALFILACGFGHFIESLMFQYPLYRLAGVWKVVTAVVSWVTVLALIPVVPRVMKVVTDSALGKSPPSDPFGDTTLHQLAAPYPRERIGDYILAILSAVLALLLRAAIDSVAQTDQFFVLPLLAVVFVSWQAGFWPAIVTLFVCLFGMLFFFMPPKYSFIVQGFSNQIATALFFFCGVCCAGLGQAQWIARRGIKSALAIALDRKAALEVEVIRRKEAEDGLREVEARFRSMADSVPALIWLSDLTPQRTYFNKTWLEFTGRTLAQELGDGWTEHLHPEDRVRYLTAYSTAVAVREPFEVEYRLRRRDGVYRWVLARGTPRFTPSGAFAGFVGLCMDVTDRKLADEAVRRSENNLSDFFENANVGLQWLGGDGVILRANKAELDLLGYTREEYIGHRVCEFHTQTETSSEILARLNRGEKLDNYPAQLRCKDGSTRDVIIASTGFWEGGKFVHSRSFTRDVTELKQVTEGLRRSEARYRTLTEMIPQLVWNAGGDGEISYLNQRWLDYTGTSLEKSDGKGWLAAVHPDDVERVYTAWQRTVSNNSPDADRFSQELRLRRASDGVYRWMLGVAVPLYKPDGTVDQWIGAMADIDDQKRQAENLEHMVRRRTAALLEQIEERRRAEQQVQAVATELQRSNAELEQFAYVASHDLQEPLRKIQAFGDRLKVKVREELPETGREYVDRMLNSAGRMRRLIDDLLTFSRVTTQPRAFVRIKLAEVVDEVVSDLSERIEQAGGDVRVGELPEIDADPTQMRQLFQNLIANAVKFQRPGVPPVVEIEGELVAESPKPNTIGEPLPICQLTIRDNGIGFDEKYLDRIFQVFQRLHGRGEYEGTGIGLAICRKIVERHGGAITARSRLGEGTAFVVTLPIRQPHPAAETPAKSGGDSRWREAVHTDEQRKQETAHDPDGRRRSGRSPTDQRGVRGEPPGE
jgi:PAS domain S-box-containing protein